MKNLGRALRMTLKYRWSLVTSLVCSVCVAVLWSLSLGAVYPFVEIVLEGKTLHQWVNVQQDDSQRLISDYESEIGLLNDQLLTANDEQQNLLQRKIQVRRQDITTQQAKLATAKNLVPYIEKYAPQDPFSTLAWLMILMLLGTLARVTFLMGSMLSVARISQRTMLDLQNGVFRNVLDMEPSELEVKGTGDLINRIRGETGAIGQSIMILYGKTVREPLKMIGCLTGAAMVNWRLLIFSLLVCPLAGYLMLKLARVTKRANRRAMEDSARLLNRLYQALSYMRIVKAFTMEDSERQRFQVVARDVYKKSMRISLFNSLSRVNTELLGVSMLTLSVLAGGYLVLNHQTHLFGIRMCDGPMGFGQVMLFFGFLIGVADPLRKMADVYNLIQGGVVAADRVFPLLDKRAAVVDPENPLPLPAGQLSVEFDDVRFEYEPNKPVLNGVSAKIEAGTSLAMIGHNGCGKSTMINLIPRFFDANSNDPEMPAGVVRVGGIDVRKLRVKELRSRIGYVSQMTMLFSDTVAENIAYGCSDATREAVIQAAKQAHAHEFIMSMEDGYDTDIGEYGGKLSGGQRQRISLARAILKDPDILILDEATSQIDPESKQLIHETLSEFMRGRTTIVITHRYSTLELVDQIMIVKEGMVIDCGTHERLMVHSEEYQRMNQLPMEGAA